MSESENHLNRIRNNLLRKRVSKNIFTVMSLRSRVSLEYFTYVPGNSFSDKWLQLAVVEKYKGCDTCSHEQHYAEP